MVEVCLHNRAWFVSEFIVKGGEVKKGPANAIIKIAAGVAGPWKDNAPVQPQAYCIPGYPKSVPRMVTVIDMLSGQLWLPRLKSSGAY